MNKNKKGHFILQQFEIHIPFANVVKPVPLLIVVVHNFEFPFHNVESSDELDLIRQESRPKKKKKSKKFMFVIVVIDLLR